MLKRKRGKILRNEKGFSIPELMVVLLVASIILVLALPQMISSRRLMKFASIQRQFASTLNEARQEAMSQRRTVVFRYDDSIKKITIHGGSFGGFGDAKNKTFDLTGSGVSANEIIYGRPSGAPTSALGDTTNLTALVANVVSVTFQPDGSVINASNNPENKAFFFYNSNYANDTAFAVSVLGAGGRVKVWRYNHTSNQYVE